MRFGDSSADINWRLLDGEARDFLRVFWSGPTILEWADYFGVRQPFGVGCPLLKSRSAKISAVIGTSGQRFPFSNFRDEEIQLYEKIAREGPNPPTGRLGIVHSSLQRRRERGSRIPQPAGWGLFIPAYKGEAIEASKSPNRQVGIVHSCLQRRGERGSRIPQPAGWGLFIPAYLGRQTLAWIASRLIVDWKPQSVHVGRNERSPTCRLGDLRRCCEASRCRQE
jgi:hypothetical protein